MSGYADALALIADTIASTVRPQPPVPVSKWLAENIVLVDGPNAGSLWSPEGAPYLIQIADLLSDDHPCNLVTIRKSQQTGASILALGWSLYVAAREPANLLYAVPGLDALRDLNGQKLGPLIEAWNSHLARQRPPRTPVIQPQTSRSGVGSTTFEKKYTGGYMALANANAAMDLSSKTVKKGVKDELSKWQDIPGFGDPETLFFGRFTAFRRTRDYKILEISTPEEDSGDELGEGPNHCRIDRSFRRSDQRYWHLACPECGHVQTWTHKPTISTRDLASGDAAVGKGGVFLVDPTQPHKSALVCAGCGHLISEPERVAMVRAGQWIATATEPDRHPGFHLDAYISLMMSLEAMGEDWLKAQRAGTEKAEKDYSNLVLGLPYRYRGDAPDHMRLMERREDFRLGVADTIITKKFGRRSVQQSYVYDHRSLAEDLADIELPPEAEERLGQKASQVFKLILANKTRGPVVDEFRRVEREYGEEAAFDYLNAEADGLHVTPYGLCMNSFTSDPCPKHLECFNGCLHLARTAVISEQENLERMRRRFEKVIAELTSLPEGRRNIGWRNQLSHARIRLGNLVKALATDTGAQVFPEGRDLSQTTESKAGSTLIDSINRLRPLDD